MISKALALRLNAQRVSTDDLIEKKAGQSIKDIVALKGWDHFRALEREVIISLEGQKGIIIDCGGGIVLNPLNLTSLNRNGTIFYLDAPPQVIYERIKNDTARPLVNVPNPLAELTKIYNERFPLYAKADFTIDASDPSIEGPIVQILAKAK